MVRKRLSTDFKAACQMLNELRSRADNSDFGILDNAYPWAELKREFLAWAQRTLRPATVRNHERALMVFERCAAPKTIASVTPSGSWRIGNGGSAKRRTFAARMQSGRSRP